MYMYILHECILSYLHDIVPYRFQSLKIDLSELRTIRRSTDFEVRKL